jgi:hypothetical protein
MDELISQWHMLAPLAGGGDQAQRSRVHATIMEQIHVRTDVLKSYWGSLYTQAGLPDGGLGVFEFQSPIQTITIDDYVSHRINTLATSLSAQIHGIIVSVLSDESVSEERLLEAISHWWALRTLLLQAGCRDEDAGVLAQHGLSRRFVELQYAYQNCRRQYMRAAVARLNQKSMDDSRVRMDGTEWLIMNMLSSRRERAELFVTAADYLERQVSQGQYPSQRELYFIANTILQTAAELQQRKVLTWNGLQPMDHGGARGLSSDERILSLQLARAQQLIVNLTDATTSLRLANPDYYLHIGEIWSAIFPAVSPESWVAAGLAQGRVGAGGLRAGSESLALRVRCQEGNEASCLIWMQRLHADLESDSAQYVPDRWVRLMCGSPGDEPSMPIATRAHIRPRVFSQLVAGFMEMRNQSSLRYRRYRSRWNRAKNQIESCLARDVREAWSTPIPATSLMMNCINNEQWLRIAENPSRVDLTQIDTLPSCPDAERNRVLQWALELGRYAKTLTGESWHETGIAKLRRHRIWHDMVNPNRRIPSPISASEERIIRDQMALYFRDGRRDPGEILMELTVGSTFMFWRRSFRAYETPDYVFSSVVNVSSGPQRPTPYD